ncbi:HD domain-containing protein [Alkalinema sp. FACHB-956]|uniref:HD domain-containing protein n=1 Tax=Alkalinema sp. FACHB-956 TaxID=2692768 RepID=UPI001687F4C8|nr:HD domain-containing protein [Alkalinema sp. FACHB-956]MBD2329456.1 HD domain-containing protein [Alkalinema sp. FACHB-956]
MTERTYHDALHGAITLNGADSTEGLLIRLIDTPAFQRLRRIRQLGPASLTFHGAEGSRFTHSLGVLAVARRAFDRLAGMHPQLEPFRSVVLCAALLHDIGHSALSHTGEEIFGTHHELWTGRILQESLPIRQLLDRFNPELLPQLEAVYHKKHPIPLVWQLVSSQLDCDRLDYLMRDSYFTGASYGHIDLDRILLALRYDPVTQQLTVAQKGMAAIEHYLVVRSFMYAQVYNHPKNLAATWTLERLFVRARDCWRRGELWADEVMAAWLEARGDQLSLDNYLALDDYRLLYHIQRWQGEADSVLAELCRQVYDRDLPKAIEVTSMAPEQQQSLLAQAHRLALQQGHPPDDAIGMRVACSRGYTLYQRGINLQTTQGLQEISERSALVRTLIQPIERTYLICPRTIVPLLQFDPPY